MGCAVFQRAARSRMAAAASACSVAPPSCSRARRCLPSRRRPAPPAGMRARGVSGRPRGRCAVGHHVHPPIASLPDRHEPAGLHHVLHGGRGHHDGGASRSPTAAASPRWPRSSPARATCLYSWLLLGGFRVGWWATCSNSTRRSMSESAGGFRCPTRTSCGDSCGGCWCSVSCAAARRPRTDR